MGWGHDASREAFLGEAEKSAAAMVFVELLVMPIQKNCVKCSRPFQVPDYASHKRFCSKSCRQDWHSGQRKLALALKAQLENNDPGQDEKLYDRIARISGVDRDKVKMVCHALSRVDMS